MLLWTLVCLLESLLSIFWDITSRIDEPQGSSMSNLVWNSQTVCNCVCLDGNVQHETAFWRGDGGAFERGVEMNNWAACHQAKDLRKVWLYLTLSRPQCWQVTPDTFLVRVVVTWIETRKSLDKQNYSLPSRPGDHNMAGCHPGQGNGFLRQNSSLMAFIYIFLKL